MNSSTADKVFQLIPVGYVRGSEAEGLYLDILEPYRPALKQLAHFSHVIVFWWADQCDYDEAREFLRAEPDYAPGHVTGVFATRSPARPNPLAVTTCVILGVDEAQGIVQLAWIDAFPGTAVVDLKAYFPTSDRVRAPRVPAWLSDWPDFMPESAEDFGDWVPPQ